MTFAGSTKVPTLRRDSLGHELRVVSGRPQVRDASAGGSLHLTGHPAVFNSQSQILGVGASSFREIVKPGLHYSEMLAPFVVAGVGVSMAIPAAQNSVVGSVAMEAIGKAAGANSMMRELGGVFGIAVVVAVFAAAGSYASAHAFTDDARVLDAFVALEEDHIRKRSDAGHERVRKEREAKEREERAKRARDRLTLRVLIEDWKRLHLAGRRASYAAEAVRALHCAFADALDDAVERTAAAAEGDERVGGALTACHRRQYVARCRHLDRVGDLVGVIPFSTRTM